ncbi:uncharacterized protein LOC106642854 isoform X2 [Copidosoma floridanum]|uniref:uncharacterized protein LOC106642854 isoform X2 n=1 Tax=Copidosoma floridanum TaxID=29053 RepID=UPI0006C9E440|nr:uncharacterized protein LOC106642854 isoform X2 [Copidosoma floridanum]
MDTWYASCNRLGATAGITSAFQISAPNNNNDQVSHHLSTTAQTLPSTTTAQLLLPAAAPTTLAGQSSSFNSAGFLTTPTAVGYDVFTPFFSHTNSKQQTHYVSQTSQPIARAQVVATSKPDSPVESCGNYASPQQDDTYYEHQSSVTSPSTVNWNLSHPTTTQITSPFGILPHESVAVSSPPTTTTTADNGVGYDNNFVTHYSNGTGITRAESKTDARESSPMNNGDNTIKCIVTESSMAGAHTFFQSANAFDSDGLSTSYSTDDQSATNSSAVQSSMHHQSCIVSTPSPANRITQMPSRSPVLTTIYLSTSVQDKPTVVQGNHTSPDQGHDSSQSSPISFSMMDSHNLSYSTANSNGTVGKAITTNGGVQQFHVLNQQQQQAPSSCRHYNSAITDSTGDFHMQPARSKSATSTDSAYSSNTSQNGPDCAQVVVPRRPSPMQSHSQASPLGHVPSPATYPMYNSPIASMSSPSSMQQQCDGTTSTPYKAGGVTQQMTPPSPLDVNITRSPSQQNQVVYSSVITRALGANENKTYNTDASSRATFETQCWDNESHQSNDPQKFSNSTYLTTDSNETSVLTSHGISQNTSCMDSSSMNLQNLSSCRQHQRSMPSLSDNEDDDMNDVEKQHIQVQEATIIVPVSEKCQSLDKPPELITVAPANEYQIQAPIHHSVVINQQQPTVAATVQAAPQPQQNGYIEFERWNLTALPHNTKIITATPATTFTVQPQPTPQIHTANLVGAVTHQTQPILVTHQAPAPTISYFPTTFHIAPATHHMAAAPVQQQTHHLQQQQHQPQHQQQQHHHQQQQQQQHQQQQQQIVHEMNPTIGMNSVTMTDIDNSCQQNNNLCVVNSLDKPEVINPNIEEELEYLSSNVTPAVVNNPPPVTSDIRRVPNNDPNSGFMTSYLKFLQGEKDSSPPPSMRGRRNNAWNNRNPYGSMESNGVDPWGRNISSVAQQNSSDKSKEMPTIDYANDPRYFPLPKERKSHSFDSSDDGFSSDDELPPFGSKRKPNQVESACQVESQTIQMPAPMPPLPTRNLHPDGRPRKGRPIKPGGPTDRKRKAAEAAAAAAAEAAAKGIVLPPVTVKKRMRRATQLPRRESSRRKAKDNTSVKQMLDSQQSVEDHEAEEEQDSDSDPAWTPAAKPVEDHEDKRRKRGRAVIGGKRRKLMDGTIEFSTELVAGPKRGRKRKHPIDPAARSNAIKLSCKIDEKLLASISDEDIDISPFKSGEFVVIKSDLEQEYPPLWRIDGKTLLQKYEPFQSNGKFLYRNISTYSGWAPQNRHIYQQVPVKFWQQGKMETIVEFLRDDMIIDDSECISRFMKDTEKYQDNFEVYIQTLISQALDSNFLTEIFQEKDDYFLSNVKTVDEITEERKQRLLSTTNWQSNVVTALSTWPCINVLRDNIADYKGKSCAGCSRVKIHARVLLYGQPYNSTTLEGSQPNPQVPQEKDFMFCRICQTKVALFNKVAHQKYLMFLECARRVADKRIADPLKDTTIILNELLADELWLNQLFRDVRRIWGEIDSIHQQMKKKEVLANKNAANNALAQVNVPNMPEALHMVTESQAIVSFNSQMCSNFS